MQLGSLKHVWDFARRISWRSKSVSGSFYVPSKVTDCSCGHGRTVTVQLRSSENERKLQLVDSGTAGAHVSDRSYVCGGEMESTAQRPDADCVQKRGEEED